MGKKSYTRWLFVLPAIVIVIALFIYPICSSIVYSFTNKNLIKPAYKFIGLKNYAEVLKDSGFWLSFFNSLKWTVLSLVGQIGVGFTAALALKRIKVCKGVYKTLLIIPWAFPSIVIAFSWKWILNGVYGFLPNILVKLGICQVAPVSDQRHTGLCQPGADKYMVRSAHDNGQRALGPGNSPKGPV